MSLNITEFINFLSNANTHIPVEANFKITIDNVLTKDGDGLTIIEKLVLKENEMFQADNSNLLQIIDSKSAWPESVYKNQGTILFANGVTVPGESTAIARAGAASDTGGLHGGLLSAPIIKGRKDLSNLEITFLETNVSFIDSVLRPWAVAVSHYGLFARDRKSYQNFKTNVTVDYLSKEATSVVGMVRKRIKFNDAAPVEVGGFETSYGSTGKSTEMRVTKTVWTYSTYSIQYPDAEPRSKPSLAGLTVR